MIYLEDFCFVLEYLRCVNTICLLDSCDILHLIEKKKYFKYRMNYIQLKKHMTIQDKCFEKLENMCGVRFDKMRERVSNRHFYNFDQYVKKASCPLSIRLCDAFIFCKTRKQGVFRDITLKGWRNIFFWKTLFFLSPCIPLVKQNNYI